MHQRRGVAVNNIVDADAVLSNNVRSLTISKSIITNRQTVEEMEDR